MFAFVIELSPGSVLIELPVAIRRPTYDHWVFLTGERNKGWWRSSSILDVSFCECNWNGFLSHLFHIVTDTKSRSSKFSVKVLRWFMNSGWMGVGPSFVSQPCLSCLASVWWILGFDWTAWDARWTASPVHNPQYITHVHFGNSWYTMLGMRALSATFSTGQSHLTGW